MESIDWDLGMITVAGSFFVIGAWFGYALASMR